MASYSLWYSPLFLREGPFRQSTSFVPGRGLSIEKSLFYPCLKAFFSLAWYAPFSFFPQGSFTAEFPKVGDSPRSSTSSGDRDASRVIAQGSVSSVFQAGGDFFFVFPFSGSPFFFFPAQDLLLPVRSFLSGYGCRLKPPSDREQGCSGDVVLFFLVPGRLFEVVSLPFNGHFFASKPGPLGGHSRVTNPWAFPGDFFFSFFLRVDEEFLGPLVVFSDPGISLFPVLVNFFPWRISPPRADLAAGEFFSCVGFWTMFEECFLSRAGERSAALWAGPSFLDGVSLKTRRTSAVARVRAGHRVFSADPLTVLFPEGTLFPAPPAPEERDEVGFSFSLNVVIRRFFFFPEAISGRAFEGVRAGSSFFFGRTHVFPPPAALFLATSLSTFPPRMRPGGLLCASLCEGRPEHQPPPSSLWCSTSKPVTYNRPLVRGFDQSFPPPPPPFP